MTAPDENPDSIEESDLPDRIPDVIRSKIAGAFNLALMDNEHTPDVTLVESANTGGLDYDYLTELADEMGLDVDQMNASGMGIADSPEDLEYRDPDSQAHYYCKECESRQLMDQWKTDRHGTKIISVECPECGAEGGIFPEMMPPVYTGTISENNGQEP